jgi:hypothetical protein
MKKKSTKKVLILVAVFSSFLLINASTGSAFISTVQLGGEWEVLTRLISIRQSYLNIWPEETINKIDLIQSQLTFIAQNPLPNLWIPPEVTEQAIAILDRITASLINPQPEPPIPPNMSYQFVPIMERITAILINPQPEPPMPEELIAQGFNVLDRVSWILINPQPEPPALPQELIVKALEIIYRVSGFFLSRQTDDLQDVKIPAFNALDQLSSHLVAPKKVSPSNRVSAHLNAMYKITQLYLTN